MLKLKRAINTNGIRTTVSINQVYFAMVKAYSESTGYTMTSIVETAIEQFFPNVDWEELAKRLLAGFDNDE